MNFLTSVIFIAPGIIAVGIIAGLAVTLARMNRRPGGIVLSDELRESGLDDAPALLGQTGEAVTPLKPFGFAEFQGRRVEVTSRGELIAAGARVCVIEVYGGKVIVKEAVGGQ